MGEVFEMPVKVSWTTKLSEMEVGETLRVSLNVGRKTVAPRISREIKLMHPDREYPTDAKSEPGILIIKRKK
jgi:hypothetical protein